jgi:hypothetical protein
MADPTVGLIVGLFLGVGTAKAQHHGNTKARDGLCGNRRPKSFSPDFLRDLDVGNRQVLNIVGAFRGSKGLLNLICLR